MTPTPQKTSDADMLTALTAAIQDCDSVVVEKLNALFAMDTQKFSGDVARALIARAEPNTPEAPRHVFPDRGAGEWVAYEDYAALQAIARESAMQELASLSQAQEAYAAQVKAEAERDEAIRRRDSWRAKAEGFDAVRLALREKVGDPWPRSLSRVLWAGIAADEKARADALQAEVERLREALKPFAFLDHETSQAAWECCMNERFQDWIDYGDIEAARTALEARA